MHTPAPRLGDRSLFPRLEAKSYLAYAAVAPPSAVVERAVADFVAAQAASGVSAFMAAKRTRELFRPVSSRASSARTRRTSR
jgi:predicted transcriptional regulator